MRTVGEWVVVSFLTLGLASTARAAPRCERVAFMPEDATVRPAVQAPGGRLRALLESESAESETTLRVLRGDAELGRFLLQDLSAQIDVAWSPDARALFVQWSDGGAVGGFHVRVFEVEGDRVVERPTTAQAEEVFRRKHDCASRGINVFAVRWEGSQRLLLTLEVYPTSDCGRELGVARSFVVRTRDGAILDRVRLVSPPEVPRTCWPVVPNP